MYISATLVPTQAGILPHGHGIEGDHRNMFIDFEHRNFLGEDLHIIPPSEKRRLQLKDSRTVQKFNQAVQKHFLHNNIHSLSEEILQSATFPPTMQIINKMAILDDQIGRAIAHANKKGRKFRTGDIPYSPEFTKINNERRFWLLLLRRFYGRHISNTTIRRLANKVNVEEPYSIDMVEAKHQLHLARQAYIVFVL